MTSNADDVGGGVSFDGIPLLLQHVRILSSDTSFCIQLHQ